MAGTLATALDSIRQDCGGTGSRIYLAQLGALLKRRGVALQERLSVVLARMPDFCRLEGAEVMFLDGDPLELDGAEQALRLRRDLLLALITDKATSAWVLDLETHQILEVPVVGGEFGPPCSLEPLRYLRVPTLSTEEQLAFAVAHLGARLDAEDLRALRAAGPRWGEVAEGRLSPDAWGRFQDERRRALIAHATAWFERHHIDSGFFLHRAHPGARPQADAQAAGRLRAHLHRCIDAMTESELAQVLIPAGVTARLVE